MSGRVASHLVVAVAEGILKSALDAVSPNGSQGGAMADLRPIQGSRQGPPPSLEARRNAYRRSLVASIRAAASEMPDRERRRLLVDVVVWDAAAQRGDWSDLIYHAVRLQEADRRRVERLMLPGDAA